MEKVYLDNAATTPILPEVIEVMTHSMSNNFGNPSSTHQFGRTAKAAVEKARKNIAKHFNVTAGEIVFTSGGTEADNLILQNAVINLGVQTIITTKIEHHAVLHTIDFLKEVYGVTVVYLEINDKGDIHLDELKEALLKSNSKTLVSLMWVNNEIGNLLPIKEVAQLCKEYNAYFHSDTVQAIGHYELDLQEIPVDFIVASAHKFHGPKGVGFAFVKKGIALKPMLHGGDQERGMRSSTENVHAILGMEKALEISLDKIKEDKEKIESLKEYFIEEIKTIFPNVEFNGQSGNLEKSSYTIVNVRFPFNDKMMIFNLDLNGVAVSGGSACQSGSDKGSHVLGAFLKEAEAEKSSIRFSFSKLNKREEIVCLFKILKDIKR